MKQKLTKIAAGACAAGVALTMAGCTGTSEPAAGTSPESSAETSPAFDPEENVPEVVYGPPEMLGGSQAFDPADNQNEDVYGPPEMFGIDSGEDTGGGPETADQSPAE